MSDTYTVTVLRPGPESTHTVELDTAELRPEDDPFEVAAEAAYGLRDTLASDVRIVGPGGATKRLLALSVGWIDPDAPGCPEPGCGVHDPHASHAGDGSPICQCGQALHTCYQFGCADDPHQRDDQDQQGA